MVTTKAAEDRALTRRGYQAGPGREWQDEETPESTAPAPPTDTVDHLSPALSDWGVTVEQARSMLMRQMCPACGQGPWKSPLNHAARKHGVDRFTMRDLCGITTNESVCDPELAERFSDRSKSMDMAAVARRVSGRARRPRRWTSAGREKNKATLVQWEKANPEAAHAARRDHARLTKTPEALARRAATMRAWREANPELAAERDRALGAASNSPEARAKRAKTWAEKPLPDHGTVKRYKRGCRCDGCRRAKSVYRAALKSPSMLDLVPDGRDEA